jgi:hypothetical protein
MIEKHAIKNMKGCSMRTKRSKPEVVNPTITEELKLLGKCGRPLSFYPYQTDFIVSDSANGQELYRFTLLKFKKLMKEMGADNVP